MTAQGTSFSAIVGVLKGELATQALLSGRTWRRRARWRRRYARQMLLSSSSPRCGHMLPVLHSCCADHAHTVGSQSAFSFACHLLAPPPLIPVACSYHSCERFFLSNARHCALQVSCAPSVSLRTPRQPQRRLPIAAPAAGQWHRVPAADWCTAASSTTLGPLPACPCIA